jgi:simple sugar transport system permease protein
VLPALATFVLFVVMFGAGSARYDNFFSLQVLLNLFVDNAYLIVLAVGMTFVIITGGIDLSVGSVVALSGVLAAKLLASGWSAVRHGPRPAQRSGSGADHGARHPPPGAAAVRGDPGGHVPRPRALRRDQRRVHPHPRPPVMGLRVGRTKVAVYAISGLCSAIGGLLFAFYSLSGYSLSAVGTELDAIAAAVIGSTLLSGGVGLIVRSLLECSCWA